MMPGPQVGVVTDALNLRERGYSIASHRLRASLPCSVRRLRIGRSLWRWTILDRITRERRLEHRARGFTSRTPPATCRTREPTAEIGGERMVSTDDAAVPLDMYPCRHLPRPWRDRTCQDRELIAEIKTLESVERVSHLPDLPRHRVPPAAVLTVRIDRRDPSLRCASLDLS